MTRNDDGAVTELPTGDAIDAALAEFGRVLVTGPSTVAVRAALAAAVERHDEELPVLDDALPAQLEALPERGLIGARPAVLDAVLGPVPDLPLVLVETLPENATEHADRGFQVPDAVRAVVAAVTDRHRLAVGNALDETELAALVDDTDGLAEAIEAGFVHRTTRDGRPHLAPDPAVVDHAEAARPITTAFARRLREVADPAELRIAGRVAVARGDAGVGAVLLGRLDPDEVPVETAWAVATAAEQHGHDEAAARWHRSVAARGDAEDARASRRAAGLAELRSGRRRAAHDLLAGVDGADRATQDVLARLALAEPDATDSTGGRIEARRRFELAADGDDELAASAALALVSMAREDGDDEAAVRWLRFAIRTTTDRERGTRARIVLIPVLARLGRTAEARAAADDLDDHLVDSDPRPWREALVLARAALARSTGDLALTRIVLDGAAPDLRGAAWAAASVELDVERGLVDEVLDAGRPEWSHLRAVRSDRPDLSSALDPQHRLRTARQVALHTRDAQFAAVPTPRRAEAPVAGRAVPVRSAR